MRKRPEVIAHRGMPRRARENTLTSFATAIESGADAIELDVHATRDGTVVVHHDPWLRSSGQEAGARGPFISTLYYSEMRRETYGGADVPTLDEVLALVDGRARLYVEIKGNDIETLVIQQLAGHAANCAIHSFDHRVSERIRALAPEIATGVLLSSYLIDPARALRDAKARDYWQYWELVDETLLRNVHDVGGRVVAWTVNLPADTLHLAALGVDAICTDLTDIIRPLFPPDE